MSAPTGALAAEMLSLAPPAPARRPRVLLVGAALAATASAISILGLIAAYAAVRADVLSRGGAWLPEDSFIPLAPGNMAMVSLLMSAVTMHWIVHSLRHDDRIHAYVALGVTLLLGVSAINNTVYLYQQMNLGIADSPQAVLVYAITGLNLAMIGAGLLFIAVMGFQALGGQLTGRAAEGMSAAELYWFVTIGVFSVVWFTIYITK